MKALLDHHVVFFFVVLVFSMGVSIRGLGFGLGVFICWVRERYGQLYADIISNSFLGLAVCCLLWALWSMG